MKLSNILFLAVCACSATVVDAASPVKSTVDDIAPYVYPRNRAMGVPAPGRSIGDNIYVSLSPDGSALVKYDITNSKVLGNLVDFKSTRETVLGSVDGFELSPDGSRILVWRNSMPLYRRSFTAEYFVYEVHSNIMRPLSTAHTRQRAAKFSPDSRMVAFVGGDNNIYLKKLDYNTEVAVTENGAVNKVLNGVPDWTYEEEFTVTSSMIFSPDSQTFCFLRYDEADVPMYSLPLYEGTCNAMEQYALYPGAYDYKYPVAGKANSTVTLHTYDIYERKLSDLPVGVAYEYIPRIDFTAEGQVLAVTLNRDQNRMEVMSVNPRSRVSRSVYVETAPAWITPVTYEAMQVCADGFIVNSWRDGYGALYKYSFTGALQREVAVASTDITACYGQDAVGNIYYQIAQPTALDRQVCRVDAKGKTTTLSPATGWADAQFSDDMNYAVLNHSSAVTPPVYTLIKNNGSTVRTMQDNTAYAARVADLPKKEFFTMQSDGVTLNGWIMRPADFNPSKKYPVVMDQYSGPGSQSVVNRWQLDWQQYFATQGYIVVCVDGRGTGGRGREFRDAVYRRLGHFETIDQLNAARYVAALPGVDASRIGICGWSYGGYEALMCATAPNTPFASAVAIAPVTDWRYYDTVYAERYMLTPQQNTDGYRESAPLTRAADLGCDLLIMYGTADDNVHPANSLQFVSALQSAGKLCDMLVFPNMNHSINGCNSRAVVYANMLRHFNRTL